MKIVQSFWTKPFMQSKNSDDNRFNGGWPSRKMNYYSMIHSCLQLRKFYEEVELVTDHLGKEILIDRLGLPYTEVSTELESIQHQHPGLWALGKIHAYARQTQPFLHIDLDIFITQPFQPHIHRADLVAQNIETGTGEYVETVNYIMEHFEYIPDYMQAFRNQQYMPGVNAGVFGGRNVAMFQDYTAEVFRFLEKNEAAVERFLGTELSNEYLNVFFEQMIFYGLTKRRQLPITYLFPDHTDTPKKIGYMHMAEQHNGYVHAYARFKKRRVVYNLIAQDLKDQHPAYYTKANDLITQFEL